jgi:hypothetical protein
LTDEQKAVRLQANQKFIQSVDDDHSELGSLVTGNETWRLGVSSMIAKQKDKTWKAARKDVEDKKKLISKVKIQSDVGHILRLSGNHSERICSTSSDDE